MNMLTKPILMMLTTLILNACGSKPYQQSYGYTPSNTYTQVYKQAPAKVIPVAQYGQAQPTPMMNFEDLIRFEYDCSKKMEQIEFLQDQLRKKTFYRVDGVEGNEFPDRINKRYYALARYRIWNLRLGCKGSNVETMTQVTLRAKAPSRPPESVPRCYFEESFVAKTDFSKSEGGGEAVVSKRKEYCTNYPLLADKKIVSIGDVVDPQRQLEKNIAYIPNLRKWSGGIFQMVSKTELHQREVVKFTVVLLWNGADWVVVDKF